MGPEEEAAVLGVLRSGQLAMGDRTKELEAAWADYCGVRDAVFIANGTLALEALLAALGIGPGDEVLTVSFSFNATASAIVRVGATPVFVDVRDDDFCMDADLVERALTPRTRAIMPVHMYGLMADMRPLAEIAGRHGLPIVEDAAQAIGARYEGRSAGSFGHAMFSLYATKNVAAGEGGMVTTDDDALADRLRVLRNQGMRTRYEHELLSTNLRPTDIGAAIGLVQLRKVDAANERRRLNAARLTAGLAGSVATAITRVVPPVVPAKRVHAWHQFTVRVPNGRDRILRVVRERRIGAEVYYPTPVHRQPYIRSCVPRAEALDLPVTDRLCREVLSIPVRPNLTDAEVDRIIHVVSDAVASASD
jgi:perosamine synthetase